MSLVVVGSVAYDGVETPHGKVDRMLGGAATYISMAASYFVPVQLVGVVGDVKNRTLDSPTVPEIYMHSAVTPMNPMYFAVRSALPAETLIPAVRRAIRNVNPALIAMTAQNTRIGAKMYVVPEVPIEEYVS